MITALLSKLPPVAAFRGLHTSIVMIKSLDTGFMERTESSSSHLRPRPYVDRARVPLLFGFGALYHLRITSEEECRILIKQTLRIYINDTTD